MQSIVQVLKTNSSQTLEEEIAELQANAENISQIINQITVFKNSPKRNYVLHNFSEKQTRRWHNDNVAKRVNTVNLKKIEISKVKETLKWQFSFDLFQAAGGKSTNLASVEKFYYLSCSLERNALDAIARFSLTNDDYKKELEFL